jgi:hypothetical protein
VSSIAFSQNFEAEGARAAFGCSMTPVVMPLIFRAVPDDCGSLARAPCPDVKRQGKGALAED